MSKGRGEQERIELNARRTKTFVHKRSVTAMKSGVLYEDALKIADKYAYDATDLLAKKNTLESFMVSRKTGAVSTQSDPYIHRTMDGYPHS